MSHYQIVYYICWAYSNRYFELPGSLFTVAIRTNHAAVINPIYLSFFDSAVDSVVVVVVVAGDLATAASAASCFSASIL
jgi:hypothetical protein